MSKKKTLIKVSQLSKGEVLVRINRKQVEEIPRAMMTALSAFISFARMQGNKDYEINQMFCKMLEEAWEHNGGVKDIVEELE